MARHDLTLDLDSQAYKSNPFPTYARMHAELPVCRMKVPLIGRAWIVSPYDDVVALLKDSERFVQEPQNAGRRRRAGVGWWAPRLLRVLTENMLGRDAPAHRRLRGLVDQAFSRRHVMGMRPRIEAIADDLLDKMAASQDVDLMRDYARPLPLAVITELLGLPEEDRPKFTRWVRSMMRTPLVLRLLLSVPVMWQISRYLRGQFELCRESPREGLISGLVEAEEAGSHLSEDELLSMVFLLLLAGHETTVHLIGGGTFSLLRHPTELAKLKSDWSLIGSTVEELLRYCTPVEFSSIKYAVESTTIRGKEIARGDYVLAALAAANCDPTRFENPERLDIERNPNPHVAFGSGVHFCLGLQLARLEAQIALERLFKRYPELQLAVPAGNVKWLPALGLRGLDALPVNVRKP
ncbi:MAG: cytochrome P450 [Hyphomicrobiaceae bacterium]